MTGYRVVGEPRSCQRGAVSTHAFSGPKLTAGTWRGTRPVRSGVALLVTLCMLLAFLAAAPVAFANGIGDLYAATPGGVLEIHVSASAVVNVVDVTPAPRSLAFSPDGHSLYVASNGRHVVRIDIESLTTPDTFALPVASAGLAFPAGSTLVVALPAHKTLGLIAVPSAVVVESPLLPGAVDLLAADRHDPRVIAAQRGQSWVAVFEPADGSLRKTTVEGSVVALAIDRDKGAAFVATRSPNRIWRLDLHDLHVVWKADLPAAPSSVTATLDGPIAAGGTALWSVGPSGTQPWATARGPVAALATSDDGHVVHAAEASFIEAFDESGHQARVIDLAGRAAIALAAVPAGSSIYGTRGGPSSASGGIAGAHSGSAEAPATSTDLGGPEWLPLRSPLLGAALVAGLILLALFGTLKARERWSSR